MLSGFKISSASFSISSCVLFDNVVLVEVVVEVVVEVEVLQLIVRVLMESPVYPLLSSHWVIGSQSKELYLVWTKADFPFHALFFRCWNFRTRGKFVLIL